MYRPRSECTLGASPLLCEVPVVACTKHMLQIDWVAKIDIANETPGGAVPSNFARERENPARTPMHMKAKVYTKAYKHI